jgi:hypothetical protein
MLNWNACVEIAISQEGTPGKLKNKIIELFGNTQIFGKNWLVSK